MWQAGRQAGRHKYLHAHGEGLAAEVARAATVLQAHKEGRLVLLGCVVVVHQLHEQEALQPGWVWWQRQQVEGGRRWNAHEVALLMTRAHDVR